MWLLGQLGPSLSGLNVLELGCGVSVASATAKDHGAHVLATDGRVEAVERARAKGLDAAVLAWSDTSFALCFDLAIGSDLFFGENGPEEIAALLDRTACGMALFTSPGRKPFFRFVELVKGRFPHVASRRIEAPDCEPCYAVVASRESQSVLFDACASLMLSYGRDAVVVISDSAPTPPPRPVP